jgi:hypothetical protein
VSNIGPTWQDKLATLTRGLEWASGVSGVWKFQDDAFQAPRNNKPWFELRMRRVFALAPDEVRDCDNIDPTTGDPDVTNPRKEVVIGQREFRCEMRVFGRDQDHDVVAWVVAERTRTRMRLPFFTNEYLNKPPDPDADNVPSANMALIELFDVIAMPPPDKVVQDRWESEAVLEMRLATSVAEDDAASTGTYIEKVLISSDLLQPDGVTPLAASLQLNDRLIDGSP